MNVLQSVGALIAGLSLLTTIGCADTTPEAVATRVTAPPASSSTTAPGKTTTTTASPVPTKPLTTAPPSELLTEITAVYDAAWSDVLAAADTGNADLPGLGDHIAGPQLEKWREVLGRLTDNGSVARRDPSEPGWDRVESISPIGSNEVVIEVCRLDTDQEVNVRSGKVLDEGTSPSRYLETMKRIDGEWKWWAREWLKTSEEHPACHDQ